MCVHVCMYYMYISIYIHIYNTYMYVYVLYIYIYVNLLHSLLYLQRYDQIGRENHRLDLESDTFLSKKTDLALLARTLMYFGPLLRSRT